MEVLKVLIYVLVFKTVEILSSDQKIDSINGNDLECKVWIYGCSNTTNNDCKLLLEDLTYDVEQFSKCDHKLDTCLEKAENVIKQYYTKYVCGKETDTQQNTPNTKSLADKICEKTGQNVEINGVRGLLRIKNCKGLDEHLDYNSTINCKDGKTSHCPKKENAINLIERNF